MPLSTATAMVRTGVGNPRKIEGQSNISSADAIALMEAKLALIAGKETVSVSVSEGQDPADFALGHAETATGTLAVYCKDSVTKKYDTLIVTNVANVYEAPAQDGTAIITGDVAAFVDAYNTAKGTHFVPVSATLTN